MNSAFLTGSHARILYALNCDQAPPWAICRPHTSHEQFDAIATPCCRRRCSTACVLGGGWRAEGHEWLDDAPYAKLPTDLLPIVISPLDTLQRHGERAVGRPGLEVADNLRVHGRAWRKVVMTATLSSPMELICVRRVSVGKH